MIHYSFVYIFTLRVPKIQLFSIAKSVLSSGVCQCIVEPMCKKVTWSMTLLMSDINQRYNINYAFDMCIGSMGCD